MQTEFQDCLLVLLFGELFFSFFLITEVIFFAEQKIWMFNAQVHKTAEQNWENF